MEVNLKLNEEQAQRILICLGSYAYKDVADLIELIKNEFKEERE